MKKVFLLLVVFTLGFVNFSFSQETNYHGTKVKWYEFKDVAEFIFNAEEEKLIRPVIIDVYADWCGWCAKLDENVYSNEKFATFINEYFIPIKLDAEKGDEVIYTSEGVNITASDLLEYLNIDSYPTTVFISRDGRTMHNVVGYYEGDKFQDILYSAYVLFGAYN